MIFITGDTHSRFDRFTRSRFPEQAAMTKDDCVIVAGDFGGVWFSPRDTARLRAESHNLDELDGRPFTTLFVPGNHENYDRLMGDEFETAEWNGGLVKRIRPSVLMLLRGEMYDIGGAKLFAFGGAASHDVQDGILDGADPDWRQKARELRRRGKRYYRVKGLSWWPQELPSEAELRHGEATLAAHGWRADLVVTHCAPTSLQTALGRGDGDELTDWLETVRDRLDYQKWFFGHYHGSRALSDRDFLLYEDITRVL